MLPVVQLQYALTWAANAAAVPSKGEVVAGSDGTLARFIKTDADGHLQVDVLSNVGGSKTNNSASPGSNNVGTLPAVANAAAPAWTEGNQVAASVDLAGNQRIVQRVTAADSGTNVTKVISAATNNETEIKAGAGTVIGYAAFNNSTAWRYLKFYNLTAANTTIGTSTPVMVIGIPPGGGANVTFPAGIYFDTAITVGCVTGIADTDNTSTAANEVALNIFYV